MAKPKDEIITSFWGEAFLEKRSRADRRQVKFTKKLRKKKV